MTQVNTCLTMVAKACCLVLDFLWRDASLLLTFYSLSSTACCWLAVPCSSYSASPCTAIWKTTCLHSGHCHRSPRDKDLWPNNQTSPRNRASMGFSHFCASRAHSVKCYVDFIKYLCKFKLHGWTWGSGATSAQVSPKLKRLIFFLQLFVSGFPR